MTSWKVLLKAEMSSRGESEEDVVASTLTPQQENRRFDAGYGGTEGCAFTVWTKTRVYFPACYDGSEWVDSVSRNPDGVATGHIGGG